LCAICVSLNNYRTIDIIEKLVQNDSFKQRNIINTQRKTDGKTALIRLCENSDHRIFDTIITILLKAGANPNLKDTNGATTYQAYIKNNEPNIKIIKLLEEYKADFGDINIIRDDKFTFLTHVLKHYKLSGLEFIKNLINYKDIDLNKIDGHGKAPLFYIVKKLMSDTSDTPLELIKLFIEYGADWTIKKDKKKELRTLYVIAKNYKHTNILHYLQPFENFKIQFKYSNNNGKTSMIFDNKNYGDIAPSDMRKTMFCSFFNKTLNNKNPNNPNLPALYALYKVAFESSLTNKEFFKKISTTIDPKMIAELRHLTELGRFNQNYDFKIEYGSNN